MLVDIITGFLGAGKTTLINKLIPIYTARGEKVVVIENEYGSVNIDKYLFENDNIAVYEMTSGCLCCTLKGNLELSLKEIRDIIRPDRVVIEPSGIFVIDEMLAFFKDFEFKVFEVNQIITVVDGIHFMKYRQKYEGLLGNQIKKADALIVSKMDEKIDEKLLEDSIRIFNDKAPIVKKVWDELSEEDLEGLIDKKISVSKAGRRSIGKASKKSSEKLMVIRHDFDTSTIELEENYTRESFDKLIDYLRANNVLRCKGFISVENMQYLLQYTDGDYTLKESKVKNEDKLLVIIKEK